MTLAWRLDKAKYVKDSFSGQGARLLGGRWNRRGTAVIYTSESLPLALLEKFVHLGLNGVKIKFVYFSLEIPDEVDIETVSASRLPKDWKHQPPLDSTQKIGTDWVNRGSSAVLKVPSILVPDACNYLLNPAHPDFKKILIEKPKPITLDPRMWKK